MLCVSVHLCCQFNLRSTLTLVNCCYILLDFLFFFFFKLSNKRTVKLILEGKKNLGVVFEVFNIY